MGEASDAAEVLVLDDDGLTRDLMLSIIDREGLEGYSGADGYEGLEYVEDRGLPDGMIVDRDMPGMRGEEFLLELEGDESHDLDSVEIWVYSSYPEERKVDGVDPGWREVYDRYFKKNHDSIRELLHEKF
ncbi:MAG: response regulator [Candidatus Nanohaloarchaea archaeon]